MSSISRYFSTKCQNVFKTYLMSLFLRSLKIFQNETLPPKLFAFKVKIWKFLGFLLWYFPFFFPSSSFCWSSVNNIIVSEIPESFINREEVNIDQPNNIIKIFCHPHLADMIYEAINIFIPQWIRDFITNGFAWFIEI